MTHEPRVVVGLPLYREVEHLAEAIESLLAQTYREVVFVVCDEGVDDAASAVAERYARSDPRLILRRNERRLGMVGNWRRTFAVGRRLFPDAPYFAWAADHDAAHPRWLEVLVGELDAHPQVLLAYPRNLRVTDAGEPALTPWEFDTFGCPDPAQRLRSAARDMRAGDMIYGLFRSEALERAGVFPAQLLPDRLLLSGLALEGQFKQVPEVLWYRRHTAPARLGRQRDALFAGAAPAATRLPWWIVHPALVAYALVVRGAGRPGIGRARGLAVAATLLRVCVRVECRRALALAVHAVFGRFPLLRAWRVAAAMGVEAVRLAADVLRRRRTGG